MTDETSVFDIMMVFVIMFTLAAIFNGIIVIASLIDGVLFAFVACVIWVFVKNWLMGQGIEL